MGDPYKGRLSGHALKITWPHGSPTFTPCEAWCECGASSPMISAKGSRMWHQQHKADVLDSWVANGCDDKGREVHL